MPTTPDLWTQLAEAIRQDGFLLAASGVFGLAILHAFAAPLFARAHQAQQHLVGFDLHVERRLPPERAHVGLVGKIDRIDNGGERSSVLLLTDEKCQVAARVEGSPEVGILNGQRGGFEGDPMLRLRFLSANASVRPGQRVFTTGRGGVFQPNILLGTIESVEKGALDSEARVRPAVNFANLGAVFVVLSTES